MKKKSIVIGIVAVIVIVMGISIYLLTSYTLLGNINGNYTEQTTQNSEVSFSAEAGDKIKFSFQSNIESGNLDIILYNSNGIEVYKLDKAKELETFFTLDSSDTYTLVAICDNFIGDFRIKALTARKLDLLLLNLLD